MGSRSLKQLRSISFTQTHAVSLFSVDVTVKVAAYVNLSVHQRGDIFNVAAVDPRKIEKKCSTYIFVFALAPQICITDRYKWNILANEHPL